MRCLVRIVVITTPELIYRVLLCLVDKGCNGVEVYPIGLRADGFSLLGRGVAVRGAGASEDDVPRRRCEECREGPDEKRHGSLKGTGDYVMCR